VHHFGSLRGESAPASDSEQRMRGRWSGRQVTTVWTLVAAAAGLGMGGLAGCSSSTSPSTNGFALAEHFDSLAMQAANSGNFDRSQLLTYPTAILAEGVSPTTVSVSAGGTATKYQGVAANIVYTAGGTATDSLFVVIAWLGPNVDQLFFLEADSAGAVTNFGYYPDTAQVLFGNITVAATAGTPSGTCRYLDLTYAADLVQGATCKPETIQSSFTMQVQVSPATTPTTYPRSMTMVPGVRLLIPASASAPDRFRPSRVLGRLHNVAQPVTSAPAR
jgi:hypothetical protein